VDALAAKVAALAERAQRIDASQAHEHAQLSSAVTARVATLGERAAALRAATSASVARAQAGVPSEEELALLARLLGELLPQPGEE
jgi:hypothetical protein